LTVETANVELDADYARTHAEARPGRYVVLTVTDSGCGMDAATRARIFEPFFTTKEAGKGTGLGLAMVFGTVRQSGGHIEVYSEPGRGTAFKVYLPRVEEAVPAERPSRGPFKVPRGTETLLLVEDEDGVRSLVCMVLQSIGYTVLEAREGEEALGVAGRHDGPLHLVVTDLILPRMGGRQLTEALTAARPGLKVLYLSGYTEDVTSRHGLLVPGVAFLQKPFTPSALARKVREVLDSFTPAPAPFV
jgi:CheY-like chemotaxis protein